MALAPTVEGVAKPSRRWLSDLARLNDSLRASPTFTAALSAAVSQAVGRAGSWGEVVEEELGSLLSDPTIADCVGVEAVRIAGHLKLVDLPAVTGFRVEAVEGTRRSLDLRMVWEHENGETVVPVNVKARDSSRTSDASDLALSLREFLRHATEPDYDLRRSPRRGPTADAMLIEMLAGERKLVPGRDYYLLVLSCSNGRLVEWHWHGLLSRLDSAGRLAISRHRSRENVLYRRGTTILPADFDVAAALVTELLPQSSAGALRVAILATTPKSRRRAVAKVLIKMTDAELIARVSLLGRAA